jgi:hypothetical protein
MPKVTRKETAAPLQEVSAMVVDDEAPLPAKPNFSALSAAEQQRGKVEFRRVSRVGSAWHSVALTAMARPAYRHTHSPPLPARTSTTRRYLCPRTA